MKKMVFIAGIFALSVAASAIAEDPTFILKNKSPYFIEVGLSGKLNNKAKTPLTKEFSLEPGKEQKLETPATFDLITITWCNKPAGKDSCEYVQGVGTWQLIPAGAPKGSLATTKYYIKFSVEKGEAKVEPQEGRFGRTTGLEKNYSLKGNVKNINRIDNAG